MDGAMGTMLQSSGLRPGGCPEELNVSRPDVIREIHRSYSEAGADIIETNTFGCNRIKLKEYGLEKSVDKLNIAGTRLARKAAQGIKGRARPAFIAGCIGPIGKLLEPLGELSFDDAVAIFREQARALLKGGADLFSIETMMDLREIKAAVIAIKEVTDRPIMAMMTFEQSIRTVFGTPPEAAAIVLGGLGVDVIGTNCGLGAQGVFEVLKKMSSVTNRPLISEANAGIPVLKDGVSVFPSSPQDHIKYLTESIALGVRVIGGCCGTTPEHIKAVKNAIHSSGIDLKILQRPGLAMQTKLASRTRWLVLGLPAPPAVIGERINPTGKKDYQAELREGKTSYIKDQAQAQQKAGAAALDINVGAPGIDEPSAMKKAVLAANASCALPLLIDSSDPRAIEEGLKAVDGRALVNSVSGEKKRLSAVLPLVKKYGASCIALLLDEKGIPSSASGRLAIARRILREARALKIPSEDIVFDALTLTVSADENAPHITLETMRGLKELGHVTILGVSNVSFGLPRRPLINSAFLSMATGAGLDAAIMNPLDETMMGIMSASALLSGRDPRAETYIRKYAGKAPTKDDQHEAPQTGNILERISRAVINGEEEKILSLIEEALGKGCTALQVSNDGLVPGMAEVGRRFKANEAFLPQVMLSAETMKKAFERLKAEMKRGEGPASGRILMATVEGDIHDIGKNILVALLENHGFEVIDLGKSVPADRIVQEARKSKVDLVGLSALMTTTMTEMKRVIERLKKAGIKTLVAVGGAVVNEDYAREIGADIYAKDAMDAVRQITRLLG